MLTNHQVSAVLDRLFTEAAKDNQAPAVIFDPSSSAQARADAAAGIYMPISAAGGDLLYSLVRASRPETVIEFGTLYGISTIYLAAAVADNGTGHVYSTELSAAKVVAARDNLAEAG